MSIAEKNILSYKINADEKEVFVESDFYVPFEPKKVNVRIRDKVMELQSDIKQSIGKLIVDRNEILFASYSESDKNRFYDVENMLFYNIGTSAFSGCCKEQLAYIGDAARYKTPEEKHTDIEDRYFYSYRVVKVEEIGSILKDKKIICSWNSIPIDVKIPQSATRYYASIRENASGIDVTDVINAKGLYGIKLDLTLPVKTLPANVMKPLLDGIICAFHGEEGRTHETIKAMLGSASNLTSEATSKLNLFGDREYVAVYRGEGSYKWNPEDERLQFAWIKVRHGKKALLSGEIYKWN